MSNTNSPQEEQTSSAPKINKHHDFLGGVSALSGTLGLISYIVIISIGIFIAGSIHVTEHTTEQEYIALTKEITDLEGLMMTITIFFTITTIAGIVCGVVSFMQRDTWKVLPSVGLVGNSIFALALAGVYLLYFAG